MLHFTMINPESEEYKAGYRDAERRCNGEWHDVEYETPVPHKQVLVYGKSWHGQSGIMTLATYNDQDNIPEDNPIEGNWDVSYKLRVTHWRYLPEPPQEEE